MAIFDDIKRMGSQLYQQASKSKLGQGANTVLKTVSPTYKLASSANQRIQSQGGYQAAIDRVLAGSKKMDYTMAKPFAKIQPNTQALLAPAIGQQKAQDISYGLRGASQFTPMQWQNMVRPNTPSGQVYKASTPTTQRQSTAQGIGRSLYGYALTAPMGGANLAKNVAVRMGVSTGLGAGLGAGLNRLTGGNVVEGAKQGAFSGFKSGPLLAVTNPLTQRAVNAVGVGGGFAGSQLAKRTVGGIANTIEDFILAKMDNVNYKGKDAVLSSIIGFGLTANDELADAGKRAISKLFTKKPTPEVRQQVESKIAQIIRDARGRFANKVSPFIEEPGLASKQLTAQGKPLPEFVENSLKPGQMLRKAKSRLNPPSEMAGLVAGFEMERDENGNPTGKIKYNPVAGALGYGAMAGLSVAKGKGLKGLFDGSGPKATEAQALRDLENAKLSPQVEATTKIKTGIEPVVGEGLAVQGKTQLQPDLQKSVVDQSSDIHYNIDRLNISPEAKAKMKEIVNAELKPTIEKVTGEKLTNAEVIKRAQVVSDSLVKSIGRDQTEQLGAAQLRLRQNIANMADSGKVTPELLDAIARDKSFSENTARLLQQRVINADPTSPLGKITQQYLSEVLKVNSDLDEILKASKGVDFNNPKQATEFYRKFVKPTAGEWIDKLRYSSMLSSPSTHITNISSNFQGTGILTPIQKTIEGGIDSVIAGLTGRDRTRFAGEGAAYAKGYFGSVKNAYKNMTEVMNGTRLSESPDFRSIPLETQGYKGAIDRALSIPGNALEAMDQFFKALTKGGLESSAQYRLNKGGKLSPDSALEAEKLLFRGELTQKGAGSVSNLVGAGAEWVQKATRSSNKPFRWIAKMTLPFVRTGTNLAKAGLESNPVTGAINLIGNEDKIAGAAKMIMGGAVMAMATPLAMQGRMTFSEPMDQKNKNAFRAAGMKPYSIKIGDNWVSYQKLHPLLAFQLATVAGITDAYQKGKITEDQGSIIAEGLMNGLKFFADQTYFKNIGDLSGAMGGDVEGLGRFASNYPTQFIPFRAGLSWINRIIDKYQRKPDTSAGFFTQQMQQIASQLPLASFAVPKRLDAQGNPIENQNRFLNAISPIGISTEKAKEKNQYDYYTNALRSYKNLQKLDPKARGTKFQQIKVANPALFGQIIKIMKDEKMGVTSDEATIRSKPVTDRARYLADLLNKSKTKEERNKLYSDYTKKGIITKAVAKELVPLLKKY